MNEKGCLILKTRDFGEDSLIVTLLCPALGKQELVAKGAKKIGAKLAPSLQPLTLVGVTTANGKSPLATIIEVEVLDEFLENKTRIVTLRFCLRALEILEKTTYPFIDASDLVKQTVHIFSSLKEKTALADLTKLWIAFELGVLNHLGIKPSQASLDGYESPSDLARYLEQEIYAACG